MNYIKLLKRSSLLLLPVLMALMAGCYNYNQEDLYPTPAGTVCDTDSVTFSATIQPILNTHCAIAGCHTGSYPANGYNFDNYVGVRILAANGQLLKSIRHEAGVVPMPENAPMLDECSINKITAWINAGIQNN